MPRPDLDSHGFSLKPHRIDEILHHRVVGDITEGLEFGLSTGVFSMGLVQPCCLFSR